MRLSLIAAVARNGVIGASGRLPWRLSSDLRRFKRLTMGQTLLMGRKTWDSIGRALPGRRTLVLSRDPRFAPAGAEVVRDAEAALAAVAADDEVFCVGGGEIYRLFLPVADRLLLTHVDAEVDGDARFPALEPADWEVVEGEALPAGERDDHPTVFRVYRRRR
ncbi:MAG TPA: dihydrofolate reductase [Thermoanaerobaculia bacterium]|nr:dihydrofolate reductase [Thermoanaerobaculia bacterium]